MIKTKYKELKSDILKLLKAALSCEQDYSTYTNMNIIKKDLEDEYCKKMNNVIKLPFAVTIRNGNVITSPIIVINLLLRAIFEDEITIITDYKNGKIKDVKWASDYEAPDNTIEINVKESNTIRQITKKAEIEFDKKHITSTDKLK